MPTATGKSVGLGPKLYCLWAALAVGLAIALNGFSPENITRLLVIAFLFVQIASRSLFVRALPQCEPKVRFIVLGTVLAAVVEGFHMISMPVFLSLRIGQDTSFTRGLNRYALDLLFTIPAYLVIFSVIWYFINRYHFTLWHYIAIVGLGQTLGDGGLIFFIKAPAMLFFLPYPMTNYLAMNTIPFLAVRGHLQHERSESAFSCLAVPGLIGTYFVCGAIINLAGRHFGLQ